MRVIALTMAIFVGLAPLRRVQAASIACDFHLCSLYRYIYIGFSRECESYLLPKLSYFLLFLAALYVFSVALDLVRSPHTQGNHQEYQALYS